MTTTLITIAPEPCGQPLWTGARATCNDVHRCERCRSIGDRILDVFDGIEETGVRWPSALAMSCAWAALLGRAADLERLTMRTAHKRAVVEDLLAKGEVMLRADPRCEGVSVPARLRGNPVVVLRFGYQLTPPIHDLATDDHGISGTLSFDGAGHHCVLPWTAVFAVTGAAHACVVWTEDAPAEFLATAKRAAESPAPSPPPRGGHLKLVN